MNYKNCILSKNVRGISHTRRTNILLFFFFIFTLPISTFATSGACSYHSGVNCTLGATMDGKVTCNDGWVNSSVFFSDMDECKRSPSCPNYLSDTQYQSVKTDIETSIQRIKDDQQKTCNEGLEDGNMQLYNLCISANQRESATGYYDSNFYQKDCEGPRAARSAVNQNQKAICLQSFNYSILKYQDLLTCVHPESELFAIKEAYCRNSLSNSTYDRLANKCSCMEGYKYTLTNTAEVSCTKIVTQPNVRDISIMTDEEIRTDLTEIAEQVRRDHAQKELSAVQPIYIPQEKKPSTEPSIAPTGRRKLDVSFAPTTAPTTETTDYDSIISGKSSYVPSVPVTASSTEITAGETKETISGRGIFARYLNWSKKTSTKLWGYFFN